MSNKIGFLTVIALVINSQIGSGIFTLPVILAPYGFYNLIGWIISGIYAISLALIFSILCTKFPETGGPHVYIKYAFGNTAAFFVGWTYWVISWISTVTLIVVGFGFLTPFFSEDIYNIRLFLELLIFIIITLINLRGITVSRYIDFLVTFIKIFVLLVIPVVAFFFLI